MQPLPASQALKKAVAACILILGFMLAVKADKQRSVVDLFEFLEGVYSVASVSHSLFIACPMHE